MFCLLGARVKMTAWAQSPWPVCHRPFLIYLNHTDVGLLPLWHNLAHPNSESMVCHDKEFEFHGQRGVRVLNGSSVIVT